jgi:hypothetical protein
VSAPRALYPLTHEALRVDDSNPRGLPVTHLSPPGRGHRCAPRILAECRACGAESNLCDAVTADVDALMTQAWLCPEHREATS